VASDLRMAAPLGLGKPHGLLNALYRLTADDASRSMRLFTALSLTRPQPKPGLEARFLKPFLQRHFGADQVDPQYALDQARDALPSNIEVHEFYMQSGALLHSGAAQRNYISQNYTHVARDLALQDINVLVQLVARREGSDGVHYSLSCNPDLTLDLLRQIEASGKPRPLCVAVVHPDLPYMGGMAEVVEDFFDLELRPDASPRLFALAASAGRYRRIRPRPACQRVGERRWLPADRHRCAVRCAGQGLLLRQQENAQWQRALAALDTTGNTQRWPNASVGSRHSSRVCTAPAKWCSMASCTCSALASSSVAAGTIWRWSVPPPRQASRRRRAAIICVARFSRLARTLRLAPATEAADPDAIDMCPVSNVNHLYGDHQALATLQRRGARFFNTCMMASLLGAAVSDTLDDGGVVSGVGGQYNFVAMAHELPDGRSALLLRATRKVRGGIDSNIRWNYGQATIPRHLRDLYITEYGVADLRGKSDSECIEAMLSISDARFLEALCAEAKSHGKLARDFVIPDIWRRHTPEHLHEALAPFQQKGLLPKFPFGSDFTETEQLLLGALTWLQSAQATWRGKWQLLRAAVNPGAPVYEELAALVRMNLEHPQTLAERIERRLLLVALRRKTSSGQTG
jgi:acyl-CoA hydrolase